MGPSACRWSPMRPACQRTREQDCSSTAAFRRARLAGLRRIASVTNALNDRPEAVHSATTRSRSAMVGRYENGGGRLFLGMLLTVGGRLARLPRGFLAGPASRNAGRWASTRESRHLPLVEAGDETPVWVQGHEGPWSWFAKGATALAHGSKEHEGSSVEMQRRNVRPRRGLRGTGSAPSKVGVVLPRTPCGSLRSPSLDLAWGEAGKGILSSRRAYV